MTIITIDEVVMTVSVVKILVYSVAPLCYGFKIMIMIIITIMVDRRFLRQHQRYIQDGIVIMRTIII